MRDTTNFPLFCSVVKPGINGSTDAVRVEDKVHRNSQSFDVRHVPRLSPPLAVGKKHCPNASALKRLKAAISVTALDTIFMGFASLRRFREKLREREAVFHAAGQSLAVKIKMFGFPNMNAVSSSAARYLLFVR